jgi:hypothetical protein
MAAPFTFWDYVRRAFHARVPIRGLGPVSVNKWLLAGAVILGLGAPPIWLLAIGGEVLYLYGLASSRRFRQLVDGENLLSERGEWDRRVAGFKSQLGRESIDRFNRLLGKCREVQDLSEVGGAVVPPLDEAKRSGMDQLVYMYLRLLVSRAAIDANFPGGEQAVIRREIESLEKELAAPGLPETVKKSKQGTLDIQKRRLENLTRSVEQRAVIESELERIEKQVELIREDTAMGREPDALTTHIDQVVNTLGETSDWMKKNADLLGNLGEDKPREVPIFLERRAAKEGE